MENPPRRIPESLHALLAGTVDYAGLFPPAELPMRDAVRNYAAYVTGPESWMLGRFVLPVARIAEFDAVAPDFLAHGEGSRPWRVTALVGSEIRADVERMLKFNCSHWTDSPIGHSVIDAAELKVASPDEIARAKESVPKFFSAYFEFSLADDPAPYVAELARVGSAAKARVGGVTRGSFRSAEQVARFLQACVTAAVPFKLTAGLHHAVRGEYALTYESRSARGAMFGYLNVLLAATVLFDGGSFDAAVAALNETERERFSFTDDAADVHGRSLSLATIRAARRLATAFGSCSFTEPVDELLAARAIS